MNKVIIINLNGNAYQLEEDGYDALRAYLDSAGRRLEGNPDRDEIIADIEQAIADKFRALLGANKTVILAKEVAGVIAEMGPVENGSGDGTQGSAAADPKAAGLDPGAAEGGSAGDARRLFKIRDRAMLFGVCNGLANHLNIDVIIVRLAFLFLTCFYGFGLLLYLVLAVVIPFANTAQEKAAASGPSPTAQEFIRRAREGYYEGMKTFGDRRAYRQWRRKFKQEMRGWRQDMRREWHQNTQQWAVNWRMNWAPNPAFGSWFLFPILSLLSIVVGLLWIWAIFTVVTAGTVFGIGLPANVPVWFAVILLVLVYQVVRWPLKLMRHSVYFGGHPGLYFSPFVHLWNALIWIVFMLFLAWLAAHHPVWVHDTLQALPHQIHEAVHAVKGWWDRQ